MHGILVMPVLHLITNEEWALVLVQVVVLLIQLLVVELATNQVVKAKMIPTEEAVLGLKDLQTVQELAMRGPVLEPQDVLQILETVHHIQMDDEMARLVQDIMLHVHMIVEAVLVLVLLS